MFPTDVLSSEKTGTEIPLLPVEESHQKTWRKKLSKSQRAWVDAHDFSAKIGSLCVLPGANGQIEKVLIGYSDEDTFASFGNLASALPKGRYCLEENIKKALANDLSLAFAMGAYKFDRYKKSSSASTILLIPDSLDHARLLDMADAIYLVRDLINTPTSDMGPAQLAEAAEKLASAYKGEVSTIVGEDLLSHNYPSIYTVGKAAAQTSAPRLIDLRWGPKNAPKVTLVGKGVCFDSGGLDLKPSSAMRLMKKDMGGAAHVLGLARLIMAAKLNLRLRVLIPAVENSVSGNAMRPLDVITTRAGKTVEVGNTDAEGRLVLSDCLFEACQEKPDLLLDFATLTGAARVALGTGLPALFTDHDSLAEELQSAAIKTQDPLWRLPLWKPYRKMIDGKSADISNDSQSPYGGAITAALFLAEFVTPKTPWAHIDLMAWNTASSPAHPEGGEAMSLRAVYQLIAARYKK